MEPIYLILTLVCILAIAANIAAIINVQKNENLDRTMKLVWTNICILLPIAGPLLYYFFGRKTLKKQSAF